MNRYFLADIHLSAERPDISAAFCTALKHIGAARPDAVYLLGDLFNAWLGDDVELQSPFVRDIAAAIAALPCPVYFQHGNRDFLIAHEFAQAARLILLPERHLFIAGGKRIVLEHGDLLCIHDRGYQRLRRILRSRRLQALYYRLPTGIKQRIAKYLRKQSRARGAHKSARITDADGGEVACILRQYQAAILIHGHTHRPACHEENGNIRYVLGDWAADGGVILEQRGSAWRLLRFPAAVATG